MADCGINVLAQQGNRALVRVTCVHCNDENLLQIIFQAEGDFSDTAAALRPPVLDDGIPAGLAPITTDELLDLHQFLDGFQSGLRELVKTDS